MIHLGGYMQYGRFLEFNVTAKGDDLRLRYPPGMSSTASADLRLFGTANGAVLSGELQVTRFNLSQGFDFGSYVASNRQSNVLTGSDSLLNKVKFDLHIYTTPDLRFSSSLARVSGDADLRLRGTMAKPVLLGRANIQEGEIFFNGAKYQLQRGDISFTNPVKIDPILDLSAAIRVGDYDIELGFHGTSDKLNVTYRSEPPLPQADIIALLAMGRTQEGSARAGGSQAAFTQEASNAILGQAINATVSSRVQKLFGVSRIKIDPHSATETSLDHGPQVTIEQQVSNKLTLTYVQPVSQASQQTIQGEYNVTRNVSIVAVRDQNGVFALDIRIRQRKR
jgi:translocation and assembly module TamB